MTEAGKQLADDLRAARALIDTPEKWIKGIDRSVECRLCAMYAVTHATRKAMDGSRAQGCERALISALPRSKREPFVHPVVAFNDDPATTHADIMALFYRAIAAAEAPNG